MLNGDGCTWWKRFRGIGRGADDTAVNASIIGEFEEIGGVPLWVKVIIRLDGNMACVRGPEHYAIAEVPVTDCDATHRLCFKLFSEAAGISIIMEEPSGEEAEQVLVVWFLLVD